MWKFLLLKSHDFFVFFLEAAKKIKEGTNELDLLYTLGTLVGAWAVIKTLGMKITKLRPIDGFAAETASALTLFGTAHVGIPVSTTHTITGAIVGDGSTRRFSSVRWGVAENVILAWIFTIPFTFLLSFLIQKIFF